MLLGQINLGMELLVFLEVLIISGLASFSTEQLQHGRWFHQEKNKLAEKGPPRVCERNPKSYVLQRNFAMGNRLLFFSEAVTKSSPHSTKSY